jgi:catechol 2,3-dioxygenase-like lactoylglutathione lyase family enzyme
MRRVLFTSAISAFLLTGAPAGEVVTFGNFIHNVASLEKSAAFYQDALGLELTGQAPVAQRPFAPNAPVAKLYGTPGSSMRGFTVRLPDNPGGLEFNQFQNAAGQKTIAPRVQDPGATVVVLKVRSLDMALAKVREAGATVVTTGGVPAGKTVVVKDPDGFYVELLEADNAADSKATGNVIGSGMMISVNDLGQTVHLYRDLIGIPLKVDAAFAKNKELSEILGVVGARYRHAAGYIPGTMFQVDFVEFKGIDRKMGRTQPYDLGSSNLRVRVTDAGSFVKNLQAAGVKVASTGGEPISLNNNVTTCILTDTNNFFFQIMSAAPRPAAPPNR